MNKDAVKVESLAPGSDWNGEADLILPWILQGLN